jgi:DNA-binding response OmpR family regulator
LKRFTGARILVVEDEIDILKFVGRVLRLEGADVISASNGRGALARARDSGPFHLITIDLGLPDISGWDVIDGLRLLPSPHCPLAILSASTADDSESRARALGVPFIAKPIGARDLVESLRPLISSTL